MKQKLPLALSLAALVVAVLGSVPVAKSHGVLHAIFAHNSDKVDGKHAVSTGASITKRRGKLVATSRTTGRLPNDIIQKAPDADKLDGVDSSHFLPRSELSLTLQRVGGTIVLGTGSVPACTGATCFDSGSAMCPPGSRVVSGGFQGDSDWLYAIASRPTPALNGWQVTMGNSDELGEHAFGVHALCTTPL